MSVLIPDGFKFLPITSGLTVFLLAFPLIISVIDWKPYFIYAWNPFITEWNQYWRLIILQFQFQNQSEVTLAVVITVLKLKGLERYFGSLKFLKIVILLYVYNLLLLTIVSFSLYKLMGWDLFIPAGPFGIIFALYYPYKKYTPDTYTANFDFSNLASFKPLGETITLSVSDKFGCQILYFMLFFNEGISSIIPCLIGYLSGYLYFNQLVPFTDNSMRYIDPLYYMLVQETKYEAPSHDNFTTRNINIENLAENGSQTVDLAEDDANATSRDDTPVRTFGQQILDTFRR